MKTVLFACVHNAGRSQMAAAWFKKLAEPSQASAISAGTEPGVRVHPEVVEVMKEVDIDLSQEKPQFLSCRACSARIGRSKIPRASRPRACARSAMKSADT